MSHDDTPTDRIVTHPLGHCSNCGEPLAWVPCLNCDHPNSDADTEDE